MLIPINRATFEQLVPLVATGAQYRYILGNFSDFLRRLLVSFAAVIATIMVAYFLGETVGPPFRLIVGILAGCYWLWGPIFLASRQNWDYRRYKYSGFWRGKVLDKFVTDEVISQGESVNRKGDLVVTENRQKCLNLEIGDETGFRTRVKTLYKRDHQGIRRGDVAEMIVVSTRPDLGRISKLSDVYVRDSAVWVSNYPYVQRAAFLDVQKRLEQQRNNQSYSHRPDVPPRRNNDEEDYYDDYLDDDYGREPYPDDYYGSDRYPNRWPPEYEYSDDPYAQGVNPRYSERSPQPDDEGWSERQGESPRYPDELPTRRRPRRPRRR